MNRLIEKFGLRIPLVSAPMALASGGELAASCAQSGILGLVGGGYGDRDWVEREYSAAVAQIGDDQNALKRLGCGFISWKMVEDSTALDWLLDHHKPSAVMLSFGDPRPFAKRITDANIDLICQIHSLDDLPVAVEAGASIIVAQGTEAGGHGARQDLGRGTFSFVPEVADWLHQHVPATLLLAAGGVGDGRGIAAALTLGADGALMGSRFWAAMESLADEKAKSVAAAASGDQTARSSIFDILRRKNWPEQFDFRALQNELFQKWLGREDQLRSNPDAARREYEDGLDQRDFSKAHIAVGESAGMIRDVKSVSELVDELCRELEAAIQARK